MSDDYKSLVANGYNRMAVRYLAWTTPSAIRAQLVQQVCLGLSPSAQVLELGCGAGIPVAREVSQYADVVGVDISAAQIALAQANVQAGSFMQADMTTLDFPESSFDAILSFYAITHIPREEHARLFTRIAAWLKPQGLFAASLGAIDTPGIVEDDWLGVPKFFSHYNAATNIDLVHQAGLTVIQQQVVIEEEDGMPVAFLWLIAAKP